MDMSLSVSMPYELVIELKEEAEKAEKPFSQYVTELLKNRKK